MCVSTRHEDTLQGPTNASYSPSQCPSLASTKFLKERALSLGDLTSSVPTHSLQAGHCSDHLTETLSLYLYTSRLLPAPNTADYPSSHESSLDLRGFQHGYDSWRFGVIYWFFSSQMDSSILPVDLLDPEYTPNSFYALYILSRSKPSEFTSSF